MGMPPQQLFLDADRKVYRQLSLYDGVQSMLNGATLQVGWDICPRV